MTERNDPPAAAGGAEDVSDEDFFNQMVDAIEKGEEDGFGTLDAAPSGDTGADEDGDEAGADAPPESGADGGEAPSSAEPGRQGEGGTAEDAGSDPWASAPETLRSEFQEMQRQLEAARQSDSSNRGRLAAMQRELDRFRSQVEQGQTGDGEGDGDEGDPLEALNAIAEDYPDVVGPMKAIIERQDQRLRAFEDRIRQQAEAERQARYNELRSNQAALESQHPGYADLFARHKDEFARWIENQPLRVYRQFQANMDEIYDPRGAAEVISMFKQHLGGSSPSSDTLAERRRKQAEAARPPASSRQVRTESGPPSSSDEAAFDYWVRKMQKDPTL